jgi:cytidyltransferase-like protein
MKKILLMGLSGSGKSTLAKELAPLLGAVVFNNDEVRRNINRDLGFTMNDRITQAERMGWLCNQVVKAGYYAVADFICPTEQTRLAFGPCFTIWMNTVKSSRFPDTDKIFEPPQQADVVIEDFHKPRELAQMIRDRLIGTKPKSMFIGRYQPLHDGHVALIQKVIDEGKEVVVALRDTAISPENPFTLAERRSMFEKAFGTRVQVVSIPDITEVCYGRKVGWSVREIRLDAETESISATAIRAAEGSTGSGL